MRQYYRLFIICAAKKRKEDCKIAKIIEEQKIKKLERAPKESEESEVAKENNWRGSNTTQSESQALL